MTRNSCCWLFFNIYFYLT